MVYDWNKPNKIEKSFRKLISNIAFSPSAIQYTSKWEKNYKINSVYIIVLPRNESRE